MIERMLLGVKCRLVGAFTVRDVLPIKCSISMCYGLVLAPMAETCDKMFAFLTVVDERFDNANSTFNGVVACWIIWLPVVSNSRAWQNEFRLNHHQRCRRLYQNHHHHHHHHQSRGFKRARHEVFCLCCCCCNPSVRKNALLTRLSVRMLHSPRLCVVSSRLLSRERFFTVCLFSRHSIGLVLLSLSPTVSLESRGVPRGTGTSVLRVVAHDWRCEEESQPRCRESASLRITDLVSLKQ